MGDCFTWKLVRKAASQAPPWAHPLGNSSDVGQPQVCSQAPWDAGWSLRTSDRRRHLQGMTLGQEEPDPGPQPSGDAKTLRDDSAEELSVE